MKRILVLSLFAFLGFNAQAQNQKSVEKNLDQALEEMSSLLSELDLNKLFNQELFGEIDKLKPSEDQLKQMEGMMKHSMESIKKIDFSALDALMSEMEKAFGDLEFVKPQETKTKESPVKKGRKI